MSSKRLKFDKIREDLKALSDYEVVVFGSYVEGGFGERSDIDVAVITRMRDQEELIKFQKELIGKFPPLYDVRVFELLPLRIKASVIENYRVLFGDPLEISEYFYFWRKMWNDVKRRVEYHENFREKIRAIERGRRLREMLKK